MRDFERNLYGYAIGLLRAGRRRDVFDSDAFEGWADHHTSGNAGTVFAGGPPMHGLAASARITIPANGVVGFAR